MRAKKIVAFVLLFTMLMGQVVFAEEGIEAQSNERTTICVDYPLIFEGGAYLSKGEAEVENVEVIIENTDESVCEVTDVQLIDISTDEAYVYSVTACVKGLKEGTADITAWVNMTCANGTTSQGNIWDVEVKPLPENAVKFEDVALQTVMVNNNGYYDLENERFLHFSEQGYITYDQLKKMSYLDLEGIEGRSIKNLSGLEIAEMVYSVYLQNNPELEDISVLANFKDLNMVNLENDVNVSDISMLITDKMYEVNLEGTAVSLEDRIRLAQIEKESIAKGSKIEIPRVYGSLGNDFTVELSNTECLKEELGSSGKYTFVAMAEGQTEITIHSQWGDYTFSVEVEGITEEQEVGEPYDEDTEMLSLDSENERLAILNSNGDLWKVYPEAEKIAQNVKDYVSGWVYCTSPTPEETWAEYWIDNDNVLWNKEGKIAENVQKADMRYTLSDNNVLTDRYLGEKIENVEDWRIVNEIYYRVGEGHYGEIVTLVLKTDGTLWEKREASGDTTATWIQIDENVDAVREDYYSKDDTIIEYDFKEVFKLENLARITDDEFFSYWRFFYYTEDGHLHMHDFSESEDSDIGNIGTLKQVLLADKTYGEDPYYRIFILNEANEVFMYEREVTVEDYRYLLGEGKISYLADNVAELCSDQYCGWSVRLEDGTYLGLDGLEINMIEGSELMLDQMMLETANSQCTTYSTYEIMMNASGETMLRKNGVDLLNNVEKMQHGGDGHVYVLRTDGTLWEVTEIPTLLFDLNSETYVKGDVNEDGVVNIEDLRMILNGVCEKIELTERQIQIADVVEDGIVDIQDLRKELRYVCGKIDEL